MTSLFDGFYQIGFVARDLDRALHSFATTHGLSRFRRRQTAPTMESAQGWAGAVMIEIIAPQPGAPAIFHDHLPDDPAAVRLHHHGFRVASRQAWDAIHQRVASAGLATPLNGAAMDGQLNYLFVDTRASLGLYSEYVWLTGAATALYDDVPHN